MTAAALPGIWISSSPLSNQNSFSLTVIAAPRHRTVTMAQRMISLFKYPGRAKCWPCAGPHTRGLDTLMVTDDDVTALRPPTLPLDGENSFWFEGIIADRIPAR